ncbi:hypothetical protein [Lusitaniella coriacea]|uniref:hypothetical protein n=1 Tax=Lusitaniella coriacea TaxID=1983105 RepID=UPI003CE770F2
MQDKFNELVFALLRQISPRLGLQVAESDPNQLRLETDASIPARGIGRYIILLSLLLFSSDFLSESGNPLGDIPFLLCLTLPGLWILLSYGKVTQCRFDKTNNTFLVEQESYLVNQKMEGNLQDIFGLEISPVEGTPWKLFGEDTFSHIQAFTLFGVNIFTRIQVNLLRHSGEPVSFIFIERKSEIESSTQRVCDLLTEFLDLSP